MNQSVSIGERLREARVQSGKSQTEFAAIGGVTKKTQLLYEGGERMPDAEYLAAVAAVGVDVRYVLTGSRDYDPPPAITSEEHVLLDYFRQASPSVRRAALGALVGGAPVAPASRRVTVSAPGGYAAGRDMSVNATRKAKKP